MYQRVPAIGICHRPILATAKPRALCRCDDEERRTPLVKELIDTLSVNRQVKPTRLMPESAFVLSGSSSAAAVVVGHSGPRTLAAPGTSVTSPFDEYRCCS